MVLIFPHSQLFLYLLNMYYVLDAFDVLTCSMEEEMAVGSKLRAFVACACVFSVTSSLVQHAGC